MYAERSYLSKKSKARDAVIDELRNFSGYSRISCNIRQRFFTPECPRARNETGCASCCRRSRWGYWALTLTDYEASERSLNAPVTATGTRESSCTNRPQRGRSAVQRPSQRRARRQICSTSDSTAWMLGRSRRDRGN